MAARLVSCPMRRLTERSERKTSCLAPCRGLDSVDFPHFHFPKQGHLVQKFNANSPPQNQVKAPRRGFVDRGLVEHSRRLARETTARKLEPDRAAHSDKLVPGPIRLILQDTKHHREIRERVELWILNLEERRGFFPFEDFLGRVCVTLLLALQSVLCF